MHKDRYIFTMRVILNYTARQGKVQAKDGRLNE